MVLFNLMFVTLNLIQHIINFIFFCFWQPLTLLLVCMFLMFVFGSPRQFAVFQGPAEQQETVRAEPQGGATLESRVHFDPDPDATRHMASQAISSHHAAPVTAHMDGTEQGTDHVRLETYKLTHGRSRASGYSLHESRRAHSSKQCSTFSHSSS